MENIGTVTSQFTADTRSFDLSLVKIGEEYAATGRKAEEAAAKIRGAGSVIDAAAASQERAKERARRAWALEEQAQTRAIDNEQRLARAKEIAALKQDIETRATEKAAAAQEELTRRQELGAKAMEGLSMFGLGGGVGAFALAEGLKEMVAGSMEAAVEIGHLNQQTGISVETLSLLRFAAAESGVEFEALAKGYKKLATEAYGAENGNQAALKAFGALGISEADLKAKGNDLYGVLAMVSDKYKEMPDGIEKSALTTTLFGKAGQQLIPILNQGSAAMAEWKSKAAIFTETDIQKLEAAHAAVKDLSAEWQKLSVIVSTEVAPVLSGWIKKNLDENQQNIDKWRELLSAIQQVRAELTGASQIDLSKHFTPGAPDSLLAPPAGASANPHKPDARAPGGRAGHPFTVDTGALDEQDLVSQDKIARSIATLTKAEADAAAAWSAFVDKMQSGQFSATLAAFGASGQPNVGQAAGPKAETFFDQVTEGLDEWLAKVTDVRRQTASLAKSFFDGANNDIVKLMTTRYHRGEAGQMLGGIAGNFAKTGLQMAEGSLLKALMPKSVSTAHIAAGVVNVSGLASGGAGGVPGLPALPGAGSWAGGGSKAGGIVGMIGGIVGSLGGLFGGAGKVPGASMDMFDSMMAPAMAGGGPVLAGMAYDVGERGRERFVPHTNGTIVPNHALGGGGAYYDFTGANFGGSNAAEIKQMMHGMLKQVHNSAVQSAVAIQDERRRRSPSRGM